MPSAVSTQTAVASWCHGLMRMTDVSANPMPIARIELQDVLYLQLRGTNAPTLSETACRIPALNNKDAKSVNHACTLLSEAIEQHRISHSINVFRSVYFLRRKPDRLCPLDHVQHDRMVTVRGSDSSKNDGGSKNSGV
jgi:hypothetical protein